MAGPDCAVCKLIRTYLLFAVPVVAIVGLNTDGNSGVQLWFARVELIDVLAWGALLALVVITLYRVYEEYYLQGVAWTSCKKSDLNSLLTILMKLIVAIIDLGGPDPLRLSSMMDDKPNCWRCRHFQITHP